MNIIEYKKGMEDLLQSHQFKCLDCRIAVDVMHGLASEVFPDILNDLGIEHIMFNAYSDEHRLSNIKTLTKRSYDDMGAVIKALKLDAGFILYPHGQRLDILCDEGIPLSKQSCFVCCYEPFKYGSQSKWSKKKGIFTDMGCRYRLF